MSTRSSTWSSSTARKASTTRVELRARARTQLLAGRLGSDRLAVDPVAGHRLVGVGHGEDLRLQWNLVPGDGARVPTAVGSLVMSVDPALDVVEARAAEDPSADLRVLAHLVELLRGESAGLAQDRVGHADLSDVVEHAGKAEALGAVGAQPQLAGHELGVPADRLRVPRGSVVAHVECLGEVEDGRQVRQCMSSLVGPPGGEDAADLITVQDGAIAAEGLGRVQRIVGRVHQFVVGHAVVWEGHHPEAHRERHGLPRKGIGKPRADPLRHDVRLLRAGLGKHQREFLTADSRCHVDLLLVRLEQTSDRDQRAVAGVVAEAVVEVLEEVAVADQQAERAARSPGPREFRVHRAVEPTPVEESREGIRGGRFGELADQPADAFAQQHDEDPRNGHRACDEHHRRHILVALGTRVRLAPDSESEHHGRVVDDRKRCE